MLVSWGCHKKSVVITTTPTATANAAPTAVIPPPIVPKPAPLEPSPIPKTITAPSDLELCEMNFQVGKYQQTSKACEKYLSNNPKSKDSDRALFLLGLSSALATDSSRDPHVSEAALRRLVSEFPNSPYKNQAEFILGLWSQIERLRTDIKERDERIKKLSEELQVLKEIDLQRRPSRPKE